MLRGRRKRCGKHRAFVCLRIASYIRSCIFIFRARSFLLTSNFLWIARMIKVPPRKLPPGGAAKAIPRANADQEMNEQTKGALAA